MNELKIKVKRKNGLYRIVNVKIDNSKTPDLKPTVEVMKTIMKSEAIIFDEYPNYPLYYEGWSLYWVYLLNRSIRKDNPISIFIKDKEIEPI